MDLLGLGLDGARWWCYDGEDRQNAILTNTQRQFLASEELDISKTTTRQRIRDRATAGIQDFLILDALPDRDKELIFGKFDDGMSYDCDYYSLVAAISFMHAGISQWTNYGFPYVVEHAVELSESRLAANRGEVVTDVYLDLEVKTEPQIDVEDVKGRIKSGSMPVSDREIAALAREGELDAEDLEKLAE